MKVVVIGSGLSSIGAIKALVDLNIKPIVLDSGYTLDEDKKAFIDKLAKSTPDKWNIKDRETMSKNKSINKSGSIPKKLLFGSDYFYGFSKKYAKIISKGEKPPFSYAKGGLSSGWGGAILPPSKFDFEDWPISIEDIHHYCKIVLKDIPISAKDDALNLNFPTLKQSPQSLKLSKRSSIILKLLQKRQATKKDNLIFGEARLLTDTQKCQYCGECMSGCVYNAIYKSSDDIDKLIKDNKIEYISSTTVTKIIENDNSVKILYYNKDNQLVNIICDKVFLGAGALNSSRIILKSLEKLNHPLTLKTRGGFVIPVFSLIKLPIDWPKVNTQPSLFIEFRDKTLKHWVHTQVASDNEMLLKMLGLRNGCNSIVDKLKNWIAQHTYLLLVNYHSDHSGNYTITLDTNDVLYTQQNQSPPQKSIWIKSWIKLFTILIKIGSIPLFPFAKLNSGSYHVGGTIPMRKNPKDLECDILGVVKGMKNTHLIDTSIFPSLPSTTIGLLMMANSYRIAQKVIKNVKNN
jgi:ferredoxin